MARKENSTKKEIKEEQKKKTPSVIFQDKGANKSVGLVYLGVITLIMGILSTTPIVARTILYQSSTFIIIMGILAIFTGLILNARKKNK